MTTFLKLLALAIVLFTISVVFNIDSDCLINARGLCVK